MSVLQSTLPELRYVKRQNLDHEARVVGNYYRDIIRSYGVDCIYHKLDTNEFQDYINVVDRNTLLKRAYGYNIAPDYSMSAHMLAYFEVEQDIFLLNKFGLNPNADVNIYFSNDDFACAMATKAGRYKEYLISSTFVSCEVPRITDEYEEFEDDIDLKTGKPVKHYLSSEMFPYVLGSNFKSTESGTTLDVPEYKEQEYYCDMLSGKLRTKIDIYEIGKQYTVQCDPYEHTDFYVSFNSNDDLYKSIKHYIESDSYLDTMIFITFSVNSCDYGMVEDLCPNALYCKFDTVFSVKNYLMRLQKHLSYDSRYSSTSVDFDNVYDLRTLSSCINTIENNIHILPTAQLDSIKQIKTATRRLNSEAEKLTIMKPDIRCFLSGNIHGNILFFDLQELGKYTEKLHPNVGDIVTLDFPDDDNCERYEITDCFDKQLTQDGISPLLHKYIWKCKARRFVSAGNDIDDNEADSRLDEKKKLDELANEKAAKEVSFYDDNQDAAYGGYDLDDPVTENYDRQEASKVPHVEYEYLDGMQLLDIMKFGCGSKLRTDGYSLLFLTASGEIYVIAAVDHTPTVKMAMFESGMRWLKASRDLIVFVNIEGQSTKLVCNYEALQGEEELCLNALVGTTMETESINNDGESFVKFKECKSYMFATADALFAKAENDPRLYRLV